MEKSVRVAVRVRPLNDKEKATMRPSVVSVAPKTHQVTVRKKTYTFDRVFGQYATQKDIFKGVVQNVADEALAGFNCTVFAYGQTGTGKTHTIQGKLSPHDENAGIIPRSVNYIFEKLQATKSEYSVRVSFLQLYNEELKDLLAENKKDKPLRLMEDPKRGGIYCQNLEEVTTLTASQVFDLLEVGSKNRIMAETLLNDHSSRSHCIFTIRIHSKESNIPGEEMIRSGTLNLVDLAGSECIGRSGARNARAREAGNINQSLLTLGRVITALVDKHPHVPYRDSKLTRLLQESLGGRAMTTVIATLGPAADCVDETVSTLDYAHRAKSIKNKPEANQRTAKNVLIKEYGQEIDALRSQLLAARAKDGIFLPPAQFTEMQERIAGLASQLSELEDELERKTTHVAEVEEALESAHNDVAELDEKLQSCQKELESTKITLEKTETELSNTQNTLSKTQASLNQSQDNEIELKRQASIATELYQQRVSDIQNLQQAIARKDKLMETNNNISHKYAELASTKCSEIAAALTSYKEEQTNRYGALQKQVASVASTHEEAVGELMSTFKAIEKDVAGLVEGILSKYEAEHQQFDRHQKDHISSIDSHTQSLGTSIMGLKPLVEELSTKLSELSETSLASAGKITKQVEDETQTMQHQMERYSLAQNELLAALQNQLSEAINKETNKLSNDAAQLNEALQSTKDAMAQQISTIKSSLQQQLDECLASVVESLSKESANMMERTGSASERLNKLLSQSQQSIDQIQDTTSKVQAQITTQTNATKDRMHDYHNTVESGAAEMNTVLNSHITSTEVYRESLVSASSANSSEVKQLLHDQSKLQGDQFNSTTEWLDGEFTRLQSDHEGYVATTTKAAKRIQGECSVLSVNVTSLATSTNNHAVKMTDHVKEQVNASDTMVNDIAYDKPTGSTPQKQLSERNFPTFEVPKVANPLLELASPKRKFEDSGGSRLQPPKKYSKPNE